MKTFHSARATSRGFTLIELMVAVAIVGILASIAYPSYREQVARSRRADAKAVLLETGQWLERNYTMTNQYNRQFSGGEKTAVATAQLPFQNSPKTGAAMYNISVQFDSGGLGTSYTLTATRTGSMANDRCGNFTLTSTGLKSATGTDPADCWSR